MASIEGKRGQPHPRPPYPAKAAVGSPTSINNVETFANIADFETGTGLVCEHRH